MGSFLPISWKVRSLIIKDVQVSTRPTSVISDFLPKVVAAGGQHSLVDVELLLVDGQHHVQQLSLVSEDRQAPEQRCAVAGCRERAAQCAVLVVSHTGKQREKPSRHVTSRDSCQFASVNCKCCVHRPLYPMGVVLVTCLKPNLTSQNNTLTTTSIG